MKCVAYEESRKDKEGRQVKCVAYEESRKDKEGRQAGWRG